MDNNEKFPQSPQDQPPPYTEQQARNAGQPGHTAQFGYPAQPGYSAQPGYTVQPGYPAQPGQPAQPSYPAQAQPHTAQPGYPGHQPLSGQPGYPAHAYPPAVSQQTNTAVVMQPSQTIILATNPRPQNWLGLSIFNSLCCSGPIGLIAIVLSCMVDSSFNSGDYERARRMSLIARWFNIISIVGIIVTLITVIGGVLLYHTYKHV